MQVLVAKPSKLTVIIRFIPSPPPSMNSSMNTPQNTPKPVSRLLLLLRTSESAISRKLSTSNLILRGGLLWV